MGLFHFDLNTLPFRVIAFVIAFSMHEWAHAFIAYRLGDNTAKNEGRLTLNPIPHLDPFGLLMILFGPFGWARPVPFNPYNFRGNKRLGIVYVAAAGPFINLVLAFFFSFLWFYIQTPFWVDLMASWPAKGIEAVSLTLQYCIVINCAMLVFNMLPIAPLDGSKILRYILPQKCSGFFDKLDLYGPWLLLLIVFLPPLRGLLSVPLNIVWSWIESTTRYVVIQLFL
ncbi:site-2 protease family protein [Brevibacillus sp. 7WMA2]|uniref:Zn-dependent protease n=1 Tax=Brevibacillus laterosporus LMG 15441 TaxID=1042163 RepID=A0A075R9D4_BRELA|nr:MULTISPECIES: site-2 protease family protein [Brevibacillus]AIG26160.1 Zn-dependent protease [Brevibacillus laterosporus LMG 15441]AUM64742.1 site-2 protease family protein [Brevibacillus laterosporus]AYK07661.1 site-2 protease family protein [Brevibacillus laterosporus]MBA4534118.1 site-2 protease family protein [Brevibacillus halotolerans]MCR8964422.1 site-2 protease family protein [Brevibacillus laterosporus]